MEAGERAQLTVQSLSDVGRRRLANEDAYHNDDRLGLYVVCDGIGGQPSGEAASQTVARALPHVFRRWLREAGHVDDATVCKAMALALVEISAGMYQVSRNIGALKGMGATTVGVLVDRGRGFVFHAGDSRLYRLRGREMTLLTRDHVRNYRRLNAAAPRATGGEASGEELAQRRLLHQFLGMGQPLTPEVRLLHPEPGDRYLLCSDGLCDPVADKAIAELLRTRPAAAATVKALIDAANEGGGPDNITATVLDYLGPTGGEPIAPPEPASRPVKGVAVTIDHALRHLEEDLQWLLEGSREVASSSLTSASAKVKRRLGAEAYHQFLKLHPSTNPSHVFHQACTRPDGRWRQTYQHHLDAMAEPLRDLEGCRLSPVLAPRETAEIFRSLWADWRDVERRYVAITQRAAMGQSEKSLDTLIEHMLKSVRTLRGLLRFYPKFLRPASPSRQGKDINKTKRPGGRGTIRAAVA